MVMLRLKYPGLPLAEFELDVAECAELLVLLARDESGSEDREAASVRDLASRPSQDIIDDIPNAARPYAGKTNKRHLVLTALRDLKQKGQSEAKIAQIQATFRRMFPDETDRNLDQVIRDLTNKTGQVSRLSRGVYRLNE